MISVSSITKPIIMQVSVLFLALPTPVHAADVTDNWGQTPPYIAKVRSTSRNFAQDERKSYAKIVDYFKSILHPGEQ